MLCSKAIFILGRWQRDQGVVYSTFSYAWHKRLSCQAHLSGIPVSYGVYSLSETVSGSS